MRVQLRQICHARSGDKGDTANLGLIANKEEHYPVLRKYGTPERVKQHFDGMVISPVERFELPNIGALKNDA
ncbi:MAG: hypothetical protein FJ217_11860 [Ignavibacteria bacterium]|nr:hypothetical protein [Ignavibacteria bacterium]